MTIRSLAVVFAIASSTFLAAQSAHAELIYGLNQFGNNIFSFDSGNTAQIITSKFVTGLLPNEELLTIDVRPSNNGLYAVGSLGNLYTLNTNTGVATPVASLSAPINGVNFGSDFNPTTDRLRFVSDVGINYRIDPATNIVASDPAISYGSGVPNIVSIAYSNNIPNANTTTLYGIDTGTDNLVTSATPNSGVYTVVGPLGSNIGAVGGFDISSTGTAFIAGEPTNGSISNLYTVNLATGSLSLLGEIGGGFVVRDIALVGGGGQSAPEPATLAVLALGAPALLLRRRKA